MRSPKGEAWWRCRESNPGPEILPSRLYMLSSRFWSCTRLSPGTWDCQVPACLKSRRRDNRLILPASPRSRRLHPALRARAGKTARQVMLPLRSYNRLRLYLRLHLFYELTEHSACNVELTYPRRIRFTPICNRYRARNPALILFLTVTDRRYLRFNNFAS